MTLSKLSNSEWEEWQGNPVTEAVNLALKAMLDRQQLAAEQAYWAGKPWPESQRQALVQMAAWHEDFFETTLEEMKRAIEATDERKRNPTTGI